MYFGRWIAFYMDINDLYRYRRKQKYCVCTNKEEVEGSMMHPIPRHMKTKDAKDDMTQMKTSSH